MFFWPFVFYSHCTNTTNCDERKRRKHKYARRCSQCLKKLRKDDYVAAHVVGYPCFCCNCCGGMVTLKTTCKKCNNRNKSGKRWIDYNSSFACTPLFSGEGVLTPGTCICQPICMHTEFEKNDS